MTTKTPWGLFVSCPLILDIDSPELVGFMQDFAGMLDLDGVIDQLAEPDQRAYVALVAAILVLWDEPAAELRHRAALVLTEQGRGPVADQPQFARALERTAALLEVG